MTDIQTDYKNLLMETLPSDSAHDISHLERVVATASKLARAEQANLDVVWDAAWLHDCVSVAKDSPLRTQASTMAAEKAASLLTDLGKDENHIQQVCHAIAAHSYSAGIQPLSLEAQIVQDADRLDALGAIGVSRCLLVAGSMHSSLYNSQDPFCEQRTPDDKHFCIDHFVVKLFSIAETLNTQSAKHEAESRIAFMRHYLAQLKSEILPSAKPTPMD